MYKTPGTTPNARAVGLRKGALVLELAGTLQFSAIEFSKEKKRKTSDPWTGYLYTEGQIKFINLSIKQRSVLKFEDKLTGIVAGQIIRIKLLAKKLQNTPHKSAHCGSLAH